MLEKRNKELVRVARILAINGEMSKSDLLGIFQGDSEELYRFTFNQKKTLTMLKYPAGTSVRGNTAGKSKSFEKLLKDIDKKGRAWKYYEDTFKKQRALRPVDTIVRRHFYTGHALNFIMDEFDINVWQRPQLQELIESMSEGKKASVSVNTFFCIREVKYATKVGRCEYMSSISAGVLLLPSGIYSLYYLPDPPRVMNDASGKTKKGRNWGVQRETRFWGHVNRSFRALDSKYIPYNDQMDNVLVIGTNEVAREIFKGLISPDKRNEFTFDKQAVRKISFIKDNEQGKRILRLLKIPGFQRKVIENKVPNKDNIITSLETEDAVEHGFPILFWLDGDLKHLYNAFSKDRGEIPLYVICEEEYMDLVDELAFLKFGEKAKDLVKVSKISVEEIERIAATA